MRDRCDQWAPAWHGFYFILGTVYFIFFTSYFGLPRGVASGLREHINALSFLVLPADYMACLYRLTKVLVPVNSCLSIHIPSIYSI